MNRLVRARPKAVEYLPEWAKCCAEGMAADQILGEITVDLDDASERTGFVCNHCYAPFPTYVSVRMIDGRGKGLKMALDVLGLDEGPLETKP